MLACRPLSISYYTLHACILILKLLVPYSYLWLFVSKFTPISAQHLYRIYRKAKKEPSADKHHQVAATQYMYVAV